MMPLPPGLQIHLLSRVTLTFYPLTKARIFLSFVVREL